ncbi:MAG: YfiR family protein [Rheinheimera sp.]|nr:YfiR family protein [Rheinheimera sp.]
MVKFRALWLCTCLLLTSVPSVQATGFAADEFSLKATFLYRFAQYTQWPPPPRSPMRFCIVQYPQLLQALQALPVPVAAKAIEDEPALGQCDVVMIGLTERAALQQWQPLLAGRQLLVVTDNAEAYRQLGMIQLLTSPDGISFQVNLQRTQLHQLKLGSQLLKLAQQVD